MNAPNSTLILMEESVRAQIVEDVSDIIRCAPFIARYPNRLFDVGLIDELAEAVDLLSCKVAELQGANR